MANYITLEGKERAALKNRSLHYILRGHNIFLFKPLPTDIPIPETNMVVVGSISYSPDKSDLVRYAVILTPPTDNSQPTD